MYNNLHKHTSLMKPTKDKKPMNGQPMHEWVYLSIMGEYLICPDEFLDNPRIQKAYAMNDEAGLRRILESEY